MGLFAPEDQKLDPYPFYAAQRRDRPVVYDEEVGAWGVYRYDDVRAVLRDPETFSSELELPGRRQRPSVINLDPPRHRPMRNLVAQAFTPRAVQALAPRIEAIAHGLIDEVAASGRMDVVRDLAYPLPVRIIAEMLGVPNDDREMFRQWADDLLSGARLSVKDGLDAARERVLDEMDAYFARIMADRRVAPQDDLISRLIVAEVEGERLTEPEILSFCMLLLLAGHVTTVNLIGNAMLTLLERPDDLAAVRARPEAIPTAIEEALRFRSPVQFLARRVVREVEIGGRRLAAGQIVMPFVGSANHDETVFEAPERFVIDRVPNPHLAFGHGIHFCVGAPLARLEGQIAIRVLLERLQHLALAPLSEADAFGEPIQALESTLLHGVRRLPMRFVAGGTPSLAR